MSLSTGDKQRILNIMSRYDDGDLLSLSQDPDFAAQFPDLRVDVHSGEIVRRVVDVYAVREIAMMTSHVRFKPGAAVHVLAPAGIRILAAIDWAAQAAGIVLTITSGSESRGRKPEDPHMTGEAFDLSVTDLRGQQIVSLFRHMRQHLGPAFTVLYEVPTMPEDQSNLESEVLRSIAYVNPNATAPHIHIQRKKGTTWPPADDGARRV